MGRKVQPAWGSALLNADANESDLILDQSIVFLSRAPVSMRGFFRIRVISFGAALDRNVNNEMAVEAVKG
jgi:hypothetical protein